jgi:hypothetical protein
MSAATPENRQDHAYDLDADGVTIGHVYWDWASGTEAGLVMQYDDEEFSVQDGEHVGEILAHDGFELTPEAQAA